MTRTVEQPCGQRRMGASIEATPRQILDAADLAGLLPRGTRVYLTDVGTSPLDGFVGAARRLADCGHVAVPHLAARRIAGTDDLARRLARLTGEAGVDDVLVIAGSVDRPAGPFASSMDLLATGLLERHGVRKVGIAGHPEGSPDIGAQAIAEALRAKQGWARDAGIDMRIVTQFGFDADSVIVWADTLVVEGIDLPVHVGVAGPAKVATLLKYAAICGVGASLDFLRRRAGSLIALATSYSPEAVVDPFETHVAANALTPIAQIHVFPFGGLRRSAEWLVERGSWPARTQAPAADIAIRTVPPEIARA